MKNYWEMRFKNEGTMWKFDPSDSALKAIGLFKSEQAKSILIPGFGYGRNGKLFIDNGFSVTGIEISESAINLARVNRLDCTIHHGSVTSMPFDNKEYDGIFCYALIHLLNQRERRSFLESCNNQLKDGGLMIFTVASKNTDVYGRGRFISKDRYKISNGLQVFFYDKESVSYEFSDFGIIDAEEIDEPVKFMAGQLPVKLLFVVCKKNTG